MLASRQLFEIMRVVEKFPRGIARPRIVGRVNAADLIRLLVDDDRSPGRAFADRNLEPAPNRNDFSVGIGDVSADDILRERIRRNHADIVERVQHFISFVKHIGVQFFFRLKVVERGEKFFDQKIHVDEIIFRDQIRSARNVPIDRERFKLVEPIVEERGGGDVVETRIALRQKFLEDDHRQVPTN